MKRTNIFAPEFDHESAREGYRWRGARVGKAIGGRKIGASIYELPDGEKTYPFHFHHAIEEWAIVLEGTPTLRDSERRARAPPRRRCVLPDRRAGCAPASRARHRDDHLGKQGSLEMSEYPDSGKVGISHPRKIFRLADAGQYWDGE